MVDNTSCLVSVEPDDLADVSVERIDGLLSRQPEISPLPAGQARSQFHISALPGLVAVTLYGPQAFVNRLVLTEAL
jgi:hypothetical protein